MSLKRLPCFTAVCDWPGCESDVCAGTDYAGWDIDGIENEIENAVDYGWRRGRASHEVYCDKHPVIGHDEEPETAVKPFLLEGEDGYVHIVAVELEDPRQQVLPLGGER